MNSPLKGRTQKEAYEKFAMAIIIQARKDLKSDSVYARKTAWSFFSKGGDIIFDYFNLSRQAILEHILGE